MSYPEVTLYDCGTKAHPRFPLQNKLQVSKPTFRKVVERMEECRSIQLNNFIKYNIEIKSTPEGDGVFHPAPEEFAELILQEIQELGVSKRTVIQSFDVRPLQYIHNKNLGVELSLLVENRGSLSNDIKTLGFVPAYYSPEYTLVDEAMMKEAAALNIKVLPWTVNDLVEVEKLLNLGVYGIITDFPDMFKELAC
jgi:glycerophosphoryl diester phosphodiesterase